MSSATEIVVGGQTFIIGPANAKQVAGLARIFGKLATDARKEASKLQNPDGQDLLWFILANIDEDTLLGLAALSLGCDRKFAEENFNLDWVSAALAALIANSNIEQVIENFTTIFGPTQA